MDMSQPNGLRAVRQAGDWASGIAVHHELKGRSRIVDFAWSADGTRLAISRAVRTSDIVASVTTRGHSPSAAS
jgi:hypothetical protein